MSTNGIPLVPISRNRLLASLFVSLGTEAAFGKIKIQEKAVKQLYLALYGSKDRFPVRVVLPSLNVLVYLKHGLDHGFASTTYSESKGY
jgi:hypothetical protein